MIYILTKRWWASLSAKQDYCDFLNHKLLMSIINIYHTTQNITLFDIKCEMSVFCIAL